MKRLIVSTLAPCSLALAFTGQAPFDSAVSRRLADATMRDGRSYEYVSELTATIGSRLTGSRAYERSVEWAVGQFRGAGVDAVATEAFTVPRGWERNVARELRGRIKPGPLTVDNVIAEVRGHQLPDEWVIVGAHLDSWDFATGAQDNGTGVAMVIDAARAIAALGRPPRRSIRFALWGGEEQGLLGSRAYVEAHRSELTRCIVVINTDGGTGRIRGFLTPGRPEVAEAMRPFSDTLLGGIGATGLDPSTRYAFQSDVGPFIVHGIPALDLDADEQPYEEIHHKTTDTLDRVNRRNLAVGTAAIAIAAYAIADAEQPFARHRKLEDRR